jgi:hypothetical protein
MAAPIETSCANCGCQGLRDQFLWLAHADFCGACISQFEQNGWVEEVRDKARSYKLTKQGASALPRLEAVAFCPADGMPIYRRWVEAGIARAGQGPACPYCTGQQGDMPKHRM